MQILIGMLAALILLDGWSRQFDISTAKRKVRFRFATMRKRRSLSRAS